MIGKILKSVLILTLLISPVLLGGCSAEELDVVVFSLTDENGVPLEDVNIFFGGDLQPRAATAADGTATLDMTGKSPDVIMRKEGYTILSVLNRGWSSVALASYTLEKIPNLYNSPDVPAGAPLEVTITKATPGKDILVYATRGSESRGARAVVGNDGTNTITFPNLVPGIYYVSAFQLETGTFNPFPTLEETTIAVSEEVEVVLGADPPATVSTAMVTGGREILVSVISDQGELPVRVYGNVYRDEEQKQWVAQNSTSAAGPTILDLPLILPVNSDNLSTSSYELIAQVDDTSVVGFWDYTRLINYKSFNTQFEFEAASAVQDLTFTNYGLSANQPANDTISVDTYPAFLAQITSRDVEYSEVRLSKWEFDQNDVYLGTYLEHKIQNYSQTETNMPYITGGLDVDAIYQYSYILRNSTKSDSASSRIIETSRNNICISTGDRIPSVVRATEGACTPLAAGAIYAPKVPATGF